ncbi:archaetidylserine decarboxylase [Endozoicomonas acroporae]|uniref:archaetidylserine decarboxylase n=1 Tax=Endozoicomonas acroporae TaxID=1701104 RepID=UPI0013D5C2D2|nr:archaetidylserine decarboxylase [Endozoicomonas acroporae]
MLCLQRILLTGCIILTAIISFSERSIAEQPPVRSETAYSVPPYLQRLLPHQLINYLAHSLAEKRWPWLKNQLISEFTARNNIDLSEALHENPDNYQNFNDFFTRALKKGARPLPEDPDLIISPVDGVISQMGAVDNGRIFQAKRHDYSLSALFAGDNQLASRFKHGLFMTIYLSPGDYHRVHMPTRGTLRQMIYVPGSLYSVNAATTQDIEGLYARNERVINIFATDYGEMAVIMVGAMVVGSMETVWAGPVKPASRQITWQNYINRPVHLERGDEMGRFKLGSTVIVLFANTEVGWLEHHQPDNKIKMGTAIGSVPD